MAEPTVRVSGIVLSSLMFQHVNSDSDVEGLLLGESRFEEQVTISDSQADHIHIEETYNVQKHIGFHRLNHFYNSVGEVSVEALRELLADNKQESVIGWYRQRRSSEQQLTLREKLVHEQLQSALSNPHMICMLLTPSTPSAAGSTHRTEYAAFISRSRRFLNVPVLVNNLGLLEQLSYWKVPAPCSAAGYDVTMKKHSSKFFCSDGLLRDVSEVNDMNECLQAELQKACRGVEESERLLEALTADVSALRRRLRATRPSAAAEEPDRPEQKNLLLHRAVSALLACSPLYHTQTLTLQALPVPGACCGAEQDGDTPTTGPLLHRKRLKEVQPLTDRKRRKSNSFVV